MENENPHILTVALSPKVSTYVAKNFRSAHFESIYNEEELVSYFEEETKNPPDAVICGCEEGIGLPQEVAQIFSIEYPDIPLVFFSDKLKSIRLKELFKNGFSEAFLYPVDKLTFLTKLGRSLKNALSDGIMIPTQIFNFKVGDEAPFDLYLLLPLNQKYLRFVGKGHKFTEEIFKRLHTYEYNTFFVKSQNYGELSQMTAVQARDVFHKLGVNPSDQNIEKAKETIRILALSLFDSPEEENVTPVLALNECIEAVSDPERVEDILGSFKNNMNSSFDHYDQAKVRGTLASLLAKVLNLKNPKEVLIAALLQDISLWDLPPTLTTDELLKKYGDRVIHHPQKSVEIIKQKIGGLSKQTFAWIEHHHESYDGQGFPKNIEGKDLEEESQLLNFVSQLEETTRVRKGRRKYTFHSALDSILENGSLSPDLVTKISDIFHP